jgi:anti-sigma-K factor RskA
MNSESKQELIALHALGLAESDDRKVTEDLLSSDPESAKLYQELQDTLGQFAHAVDQVEPPAELRIRILEALPQRGSSPVMVDEAPRVIPFRTGIGAWIPWSLAACFAIVCGVVIQKNLSLRENLASALAESDLEAIEVVALSSLMEAAPQAEAIAVWDAKHQEGILTITRLPKLGEDQDYQLWIIDPRYENPVDGGVFNVSELGETRFQFKPDQPVESVSAFAVSLERKGGVPVAEGPMVLISQT